MKTTHSLDYTVFSTFRSTGINQINISSLWAIQGSHHLKFAATDLGNRPKPTYFYPPTFNFQLSTFNEPPVSLVLPQRSTKPPLSIKAGTETPIIMVFNKESWSPPTTLYLHGIALRSYLFTLDINSFVLIEMSSPAIRSTLSDRVNRPQF